jgi:hypothetical protein
MQPAEKGRHCQSCCKTVVDFTEMSDAEIIRHLSQAGPHVCGRLMPDQLNRALVPAPAQKNGPTGWAWALASLLMLAKGSDNGRAMKAGKVEMRALRAVGHHDGAMILGTIPRIRADWEISVDSVIKPTHVKRIPEEAEQALMGDTMMVTRDSIRPPGDTLSGAAPGARPAEELEGIAGGIVAGVKIDSTVSILADTVRQIVADTMAALGWRPAPDLNIYPNPVPRGGAMQLAWKTQPGQYQLTLMNMRGQLIAERVLDVGGAGQVDSWKIPASAAAGIYILRVMRAGGASAAGSANAAGPAAVCTREVMVR